MPNGRSLGLLEIELVDTLPAYALKELLHVTDDLYFAHLWLDLATSQTTHAPFPDEYAPSEEETLFVSRLEVGTPNLMELLGLADPLLQVFVYVGSFAGIAVAVERSVKVVDGVYSIIQRHIDIRQRRLALDRALAEAERDRRVRSEEVGTMVSPVDIAQRANTLGQRVSAEARRHKHQLSNDLRAKAQYIVPRYCKRVRLCTFR